MTASMAKTPLTDRGKNMLKVTDYSKHRGGVVALLPQIHSMYKENALADKSGVLQNPGHIVTWQQKIKKRLTDINWRFLIATQKDRLVGVMFYRYDNNNAYIEEFQFHKNFEGDTEAFDQIFKKIEMDKKSADSVFYVGQFVKLEKNKEILASAGFKEVSKEGYELLGSLSEARASLRLRFFAGSGTVV